MPRRKRGGSRGPSPDKSLNQGGGALGCQPSAFNNGGGQTSPPWSNAMSDEHPQHSHNDKEQIFYHVQEMFRGKLEANVIHMVLEESDWKVDDAIEKLCTLTPESDGEKEVLYNMGPNLQARPISIPSMSHVSRRSRLPTGPTEDQSLDQGITMLSPKTPSMVGAPNFPEMFHNHQHSQEQNNMQSAMEALDSYANAPQMVTYSQQTSYDRNVAVYSSAMFDMNSGPPMPNMPSNFSIPPPTMSNQPQPVYANASFGPPDPRGLSPNVGQLGTVGFGTSPVSSMPPIYSAPPPPTFTTSSVVVTSNNNLPQQHQPQQQQHSGGQYTSYHNSQSPEADAQPIPGLPFIKRGTRKKTLSLNPEEREALENLIEDVIIGGVDDGVIDSEDTTSESEDEKQQSPTPKQVMSPGVKQNRSATSPRSPNPPQLQQQYQSAPGQQKTTSPAGNKTNKPAASNNHANPQNKVKAFKSKDTSLNKEAQRVLAAASADPQQKVYPPQLKVAVKHMKNLPPRFLRKLQSAPKDDPGSSSGSNKSDNDHAQNTSVDNKQSTEKANETVERKTVSEAPELSNLPRVSRTKEEQKIETKKRIRGMLEGLDQYADEDKKTEQEPNVGDNNEANSPNLSPLAYNNADPNNQNASESGNHKLSGQDLQMFQQLLVMSGQQQQGVNRQQPQQPNILLHSNVMNCEELERELLQDNGPNAGGSASSHQQQQQQHQQQQHPLHQQAQPQPHPQGMQQHTAHNNAAGGFNLQNLALAQYNNQHMGQASPQQQQQQQSVRQQQHYAPQPMATTMSQQYMYQDHRLKQASQFSVDAPEFIPRSFTPLGGLDPNLPPPAPLPAYMHAPPPPRALHQDAGRNSPAAQPTFLIPKVSTAGMMQPPPSQQYPQQQHYQQQFAAAAAAALGYPPAVAPTAATGFPNSFSQPPPPMQQQQQQQYPTGTPAPFLVHPWSGGKSPPPPPPPQPQQPSSVASSQPSQVARRQRTTPNNSSSTTSSTVPPPPSQGVVQPATVAALQHSPVRDFTTKHGGTTTNKLRQQQQQQPAMMMSPKMAKRGQHELTAQKARDRIKSLVNGGKKVLVLLRGPPGSGKSTLAKEIQFSGVVLSTDDFFMQTGRYEFDHTKLSDAHAWNQSRTISELGQQTNPVIIDNTNTQSWEMRPYVQMALKYDYHVEIIEPDTTWKFNARELAQRNSHAVPYERIRKMLERYEKNLTIERIMGVERIMGGYYQRHSGPQQQQQQQQQQQDNSNQQQQQQQQQLQPQTPDNNRVNRRKKRRRRKKDRDNQKESSITADDNQAEVSTDDDEEVEPENVALLKLKNMANQRGGVFESISSAASQPNSSKEHSEAESVESTSETEPEATVEKMADVIVKEIIEGALKKLKESVRSEVIMGNEDNDKLECDNEEESVSEISTDNEEKHVDDCEEIEKSNDKEKQEEEDETEKHVDETDKQVEESEDKVDRNQKEETEDLEDDFSAMISLPDSGHTTPLRHTLHSRQSLQQGDSDDDDEDREEEGEGEEGSLVAPPSSSVQSGGQPSSPRESMLRAQVQNDVNTLIERMSTSIRTLDDVGGVQEEEEEEVDVEGEGEEKEVDMDNEDYEEDAEENNEKDTEEKNAVEDRDVNINKETCQSPTIPNDYQLPNLDHSDALVNETQSTENSTQNNTTNIPQAKHDDIWKVTPELTTAISESSSIPHPSKVDESEYWRRSKSPEVADTAPLSVEMDAIVASLSPKDQRTPRERINSSKTNSSETDSAANIWSLSDASNSPVRGKKKTKVQLPALKPGLLRTDLKEQLKARSQAIPTFNAQQPQKPSDLNECSSSLKETKPVETQTTVEDFVGLERWERGVVTDVAHLFARTVCSRSRGINMLDFSLPVYMAGYLHQGCMTEDQIEEVAPAESNESLDFLKTCFPMLADDDLGEILERCDGDVEWATNILLDSGHNLEADHNLNSISAVDEEAAARVGVDDEVQQQQQLQQEQQQSEVTDPVIPAPVTKPAPRPLVIPSAWPDSPVSSPLGSPNPTCTPSPLLELCHNKLSQQSREAAAATAMSPTSPLERPPPFQDPTSPHVQNNVLQLSIKRMKSIDAFHRQHSTDNRDDARKTLEFVDEAETLDAQKSEQKPRPSSPVNVSLCLSRDVACQLLMLFGPAGLHLSTDTLTEGDLCVDLDRDTARKLHECLEKRVQRRFNTEETEIHHLMMLNKDEEFARRLQAEEENQHQSRTSSSRASPARGFRPVTTAEVIESVVSSPNRKPAAPGGDAETLREIMDTEMAMERSRQDYESQQSFVRLDGTMSTKLKRQRLYEMFPAVDKTLLSEAFKHNDLCLEATIESIQASLGNQSPVRNVMSSDMEQRLEEQQLEEAKAQSLKVYKLDSAASEDDVDAACGGGTNEALYQQYDDPAYQDFRAEATLHHRLRGECFRKAQEAYRSGRKEVAVFYSQQGHLHTEKLKHANMRAAEMIVRQRNQQEGADPNSLDLHGLHVDEAVHTLQAFLASRAQANANAGGARYVSVVTGRGLHSMGGVPKIKPAVISYLKNNKYRYSEPQQGLIKVNMK